jgi:pumilio family protein 6
MIMELRSHVIRLLLHREASQIIADIYELHANAKERAILLREFYGREASLLPLPREGEVAMKDGRGSLPVVLQGASEEQRRRILASLRENLDLMLARFSSIPSSVFTQDCRFNNSDKGPVRHAIVHRALVGVLD